MRTPSITRKPMFSCSRGPRTPQVKTSLNWGSRSAPNIWPKVYYAPKHALSINCGYRITRIPQQPGYLPYPYRNFPISKIPLSISCSQEFPSIFHWEIIWDQQFSQPSFVKFPMTQFSCKRTSDVCSTNAKAFLYNSC